MDRREAIQRTALILGYGVSAPLIAAVLDGCKASPELNYQPIFFSDRQAAFVAEVVETILPRTDTPGAKDVGVPSFIDNLLAKVYTQEQQQDFLKGLDLLQETAATELGKDFMDASPDERFQFISKQNEAATQNAGNVSEGWWAATAKTERPFILTIKELTLLGFFTSEAGATQVLQYNQVPGPYRGCVPLVEVGKAWAT